MNFDSPLFRASLVERDALVLADVCLEGGEVVTAFCSNVSRMKTLSVPGTEVYVSFNRKEGRRLLYTWETAAVNGTLVGVNDGRRFPLIIEGIRNGVLRELAGYKDIQRVLPSKNGSCADMFLIPEDSRFPVCCAAADTVYLKRDADLTYPDGIYIANRKIVNEFKSALDSGERAVLILLAQRIDALGVCADWNADPQYLAELKDLCDRGLEILCYGCSVSERGIWIAARLPFMF